MRRPVMPVKVPLPLTPSVALLAKIGSIIVHVEEGTEAGGHEYDWTAARMLLQDPEVVAWLSGMRALAFLPVKRSAR